MTANLHTAIIRAVAEDLDLEEQDREAKWHEFVKRTEPQEEKFKPVLRTAFTKQEKSVLAKLRKTAVPKLPESKSWFSFTFKAGSEEAEAASEAYVDAIYTASAWQTVFEAAALPFVTEAYRIAG